VVGSAPVRRLTPAPRVAVVGPMLWELDCSGFRLIVRGSCFTALLIFAEEECLLTREALVLWRGFSPTMS
jgi:hypothetical protein